MGNATYVFDTEKGKEVMQTRYTSHPTGLAFRPAKKLVVTTKGKLLAFWDSKSGKQLKELRTGSDQQGVDLSVEKKLMAVAHADGTVLLRRFPDGAPLASIMGLSSNSLVVRAADGYVDASPQTAHMIRWAVGDKIYPAALALNRNRVPDLLRRLMKGDTSYRLTHLRKLVKGLSAGLTPVKPMTAEDFKATVRRPPYHILHRVARPPGIQQIRSWGNGTALGGTRYLAVIEGVASGDKTKFFLAQVHKRQDQWKLVWLFPLTLIADVKAVGNLASTYARDLSAILKGVHAPGQAIIVDDTAERAVVGSVIRK